MKLHPDLDSFRNTLFSVPVSQLDRWVGKRVVFKKPECPDQYGTFTVVCVQKIYDGSLALRVVADTDINKFGQPAKETEIRLLLKLV